MALVGQHFPLLEVKPYCIFYNISGLPFTGEADFLFLSKCELKKLNNKEMKKNSQNIGAWRWQESFLQQ